jgi:succinoglycan biosynthesis transport protein ExoP
MTPREYLDLFRERWRAILAGLLLWIAVAAGIVVTATPLYGAKVTLFVSAGTSSDASAALDRSQLSSQRMQTYVKLITSDRVAGDVCRASSCP